MDACLVKKFLNHNSLSFLASGDSAKKHLIKVRLSHQESMAKKINNETKDKLTQDLNF